MSISRLALVFVLGFSTSAQASEKSAYKVGCETSLTYFSSKLRDFLAAEAIQTEQAAGVILVKGAAFEEEGSTDSSHVVSFNEERLGVVMRAEWYEHDQSNRDLFASIQTPTERANGTQNWHEGSSPVLMSPEGVASARVTVVATNLRVAPLETVVEAYRLPDGRITEWPVDYLESVTLQCGIFPR